MSITNTYFLKYTTQKLKMRLNVSEHFIFVKFRLLPFKCRANHLIWIKIRWEVPFWKSVKNTISQLFCHFGWKIVLFTIFQIETSQRIFLQIKWLLRHLKGESLDFTKIKRPDTFDLIFSFCVVYLRKYVFVMLKNFTYPQTHHRSKGIEDEC